MVYLSSRADYIIQVLLEVANDTALANYVKIGHAVQ